MKWRNLTYLSIAELLAMGLWFSASAVVPQLIEEWGLSGSQQAWMTMSVQLGFVVGALSSAVFNLPDRLPAHALIAASALLGALANVLIPLIEPGVGGVLALRFLTGFALAGVYPPGMKLVATWAKTDRGLGIGILIGALTLGSAAPHLLNAFLGEGGMPPWRSVLTGATLMAVVASVIAASFVRPGPYHSEVAPFDWRYASRVMTDRPTRLANFGYLGHMWELYAMWTWVPLFLLASFAHAGRPLGDARLAGFGVIGAGALGCVLAGFLADRWGRTTITIWSLVISGSCALVAGFFFDRPEIVTVICLIWGFAVVADSAQFSAAVSELSHPRYVGTALTMQTSLGFLLTLLTIQIIPTLVEHVGWRYAFIALVVGPVFGIWSMARLRSLPEATLMASGNR